MRSAKRPTVRAVATLAATLCLVAGGAGCRDHNVPIGGKCSRQKDCQDRNAKGAWNAECLELDEGSLCTRRCWPGSDDCPPPTSCEKIDMDVHVPGQTVQVHGASYCMPKRR